MPAQLLDGFEFSHQRARQQWKERERQRQQQVLTKAQTIAMTMLPEWGPATTMQVLEAAVEIAREAVSRSR